MAKLRAMNQTTGKTETLSTEQIDSSTAILTGLRSIRPLGLSDMLFVESLEQRIASNPPRHVYELIQPDELTRLESLGVELQLQFEAQPQEFANTLADEMVYRSRDQTITERRMVDRCRELLRNHAKRFVLTHNSAIRIGEAIANYPEMLVNHGIFARTPFDTCWIEMPSRPFHEAVVPGSTATTAADIRIGYLFHNDTVYVAAQIDEKGGGDWMPWSFKLHEPMSLSKEIALAERLGVSRMRLDDFYWGGTMAQQLPREIVRGLRAQHGFDLHVKPQYETSMVGDDWLSMCAGEVRNIIGLLLMLNQPSKIMTLREVGHRRKMTAKGSQVLMGHSVITLNLDKRSKVSRLLRKPVGTHASPRHHEVMNHWCNDRTARKAGYSPDDPKTYEGRNLLDLHIHDWELVNEDKLQFRCKICGGKRWRRKYKNGRGDRRLGTVTQDRIIKTDLDAHVKDKLFS